MVAAGGALPGRTTVLDGDENAKLLSRALTDAVKTPAVVYVLLVVALVVVELVPSPKSQKYVSASPLASLATAVKATFNGSKPAAGLAAIACSPAELPGRRDWG